MGDSFFLRSNDRPLLCSPLLFPVSLEGRQPGGMLGRGLCRCWCLRFSMCRFLGANWR